MQNQNQFYSIGPEQFKLLKYEKWHDIITFNKFKY